jgi:hypothetical protein
MPVNCDRAIVITSLNAYTQTPTWPTNYPVDFRVYTVSNNGGIVFPTTDAFGVMTYGVITEANKDTLVQTDQVSDKVINYLIVGFNNPVIASLV